MLDTSFVIFENIQPIITIQLNNYNLQTNVYVFQKNRQNKIQLLHNHAPYNGKGL